MFPPVIIRRLGLVSHVHFARLSQVRCGADTECQYQLLVLFHLTINIYLSVSASITAVLMYGSVDLFILTVHALPDAASHTRKIPDDPIKSLALLKSCLQRGGVNAKEHRASEPSQLVDVPSAATREDAPHRRLILVACRRHGRGIATSECERE